MAKCKTTAFLFFLLLAAASINPAYAATIAVHPGESIQSAINQAVSGDTVFLFSGTYAEDIVMKDGVRTEGEAYNQVELYGNVLFEDASATLKDITVVFPQGNFTSYTNTYYIDWQLAQDAGITAINSSPTIQNCVIKPDLDNIIPELERYGNGIQIWNMYESPDVSPQIEGNLIQNTDCGIYYFSQAFGGAINGRIKNNTLYNNGYGVILRMHKENPEILNNIIVGGIYAGIFLTYRDDPLFDTRKTNIRHNDIWNNLYNYWLDSDGIEFDLTGINNNISEDPLFEDTENGDFRLNPSSPCIGQGQNGEDMGGYATAPPVVSQESKAYQFLYEMMDKYFKKHTNFKIKLNDVNYPYGTEGVDVSSYITLSDTWQEVNIPLSDFTSQGIDPTRLTAVTFTFDNPEVGGTIYIDDIKLKNTSSLLIDDFGDGLPQTNSMGYWTNDDGTCIFNGDTSGVRKLQWNNVNDYWYTVVYDGATPLDASSYTSLSFKIKQASWNSPRLMEDYAPTDTKPSIYTATTRETVQAIIALLGRGTSEDITRAHILASGLKYCQEHDPTFTDGRIRDAYWSTALMDEATGDASVKSPDSTSGNLAWVLLAFIQDYKGDTVNHADMLTVAINLATFINNEYKDSTNPGFVYGYTGWEGSQVKHTYKSTESNALLYAAFKQLYDITQNSVWHDDAIWAKRYLEEIAWNDADLMFFGGTKDDGVTVNTFNPTIDADTISLLAFGSDYPLTQIDEWIEANYATTYGVFSGYDYNQDKDGIVYAPTAQMGLVYGLLGDETKHDNILTELRNTQIGAYHSDGKGIVSASKDGVTSGWGYIYDAVLNVGTTSWYLALERAFNPLWSQSISYRTPNSEGVVTGIVTLEGRTDYTTQATFLVTLPNETTPIAYSPINDEDKDKTGVQITLGSDGSYKLINLLTGTYDISVKANGYLRETIEDIVIAEDTYLENIDFGPLKAGDANNDNAVDSKDSTIVNDAMDSTPGSPNWDERADINNDEIINTLDSNLVTENLGLIGAMGKDIPGPIITIDSPAKGALAMKSPIDVTVQGKIDDASATVTVNGVAATINNGIYTATITLSEATNTILVHAEDTDLNVTEMTSYVTFGVTSPVLVLDDFEDDINRLGEWWDENGSIVYTRHIQKALGYDGEKSLKVEYHKYAGYEYSSFGIQPDQDGITNDFTSFNQLRFWVNTNSTTLEIKLTLEDEDGGKWSQTKSSTLQGTWQEFIYDFSNSKLINFSKVKNIVFTINPGNDTSVGSFNIDGLKFVSTKSCISVTPQAPVLTSPTTPPFYDAYTLEWTDTSATGGTLYELWEDDNDTFNSPTIYWLSNLSINFTEKTIAGNLYYKVRSWNALPSQNGEESLFSNIYNIVIIDNPPEIERVDSFTSSGDNDNRYERGILVNINVVEAHNAPDIVSGTIRITSASTGYDSGILPLSKSEDGTYWFYRWDTIGRAVADDYIVETTLQDAAGQIDSDGSQPGPDLTITLTEATAPLLSKLVETTDLSYPGRGMSVKITRTYDHTLQDEEPFGKGWTHSYNMRLKEYPDGNVDFVMGNGKETTFKPVGDGTYTNKPGIHDKLTKNPDGTYRITKKDKTAMNFDTAGKLISIVDTNNNAITLAYYPDNRLHTITDPSNGAFTFVYKTWTVILENETRTYTRLDYIQDPAGRRMTYGYDEQQGYLTSARDTLLNTTNYGYTSDSHKLNIITYPEGEHKYFTYYNDDYGRLKSEYRDNNEEKKTYIYSTTEPKLTVKDYYNKETIVYFNEFGMTTSMIDAYGKTTSYTWDNDLNRTGIKDPENNETTFTYDGMGNMLTTTREKDSIFYTTTYTYNSTYNKLETITDAKSRLTTEFAYDPANGNLLTITNKIPGGTDYVTTFAYDSHGQLETKTDAKNHITRYTYYNNGLLHEEKREKDPSTIYTTTYVYDTNGNPLTITDAENHTTTYTYNALNQLLELKDANNHSTYYTYDKNGNLKTIKDAKNHITTYNHDLLDRLYNVTYEYNEQINYTYDKMSNLKTKTDQNGDTTIYDYDDVYRLETKTYQDASTITYAYYDDGTLKDVTDSNGTIHYDYDEWNGLTQVTYPGSIIVSYDYDELGNRTSMAYPSGKAVSYTYDIMNRMKTITLEGATPKVATYTWDEVSQRDLLELPNGTKVDYIYDTLNRLEALTNKTSTNATIAVFTYTYDKVGNRETMIDSEGLHSYTYDSACQLTDVNYPTRPDQHYVYDPAGNRETITEEGVPTSYIANNANRYTNVGTITYSYNSNGCLTSKTEGANTTGYGYDYDNRLISVDSGPLTMDYTYDYLGRRIRVTNNGTITKYVYDGDRIIAEYNNDGTLICEYVYGNSIDEVLFMIKGSNFYYHHYDGLGSVRAITDSSEAVVETYTYEVYGKPTIYDASHTEIPQSQFGNRFYFTGREYDKETGLYYYRARYYDPMLGRFMSPDPIGPVDGPNLYTYAGNDPVNWVDSEGYMSQKHRMGPQMVEPESPQPPTPKPPTPPERPKLPKDIQEKLDTLPPDKDLSPKPPTPNVGIRG